MVSSASVNWNVTLTDENGSIIDYDNGNVLVNDGIFSYVETIVGNRRWDIPIFQSVSPVMLERQVKVGFTNYSTIIQRLRALEISGRTND